MPVAPALSTLPLPLSSLQIHGFISQGGFYSTDNDYIGKSSRGSLAFFEAGLNVTTEVADRLRAGVQLFGREVGDLKDLPPRLDWAFLDYRWKAYLGLRAGTIRLPLGLYNEFADIDAARVPILMPPSLYSFRTRSAFLAHTGFAIYGNVDARCAGSFEYQALLGKLNIPENAVVGVTGATVDEIDTKYVAGGQVFWRPPLDGLRVGVTYLRSSIDFHLTIEPRTLAALIQLGLLPADHDGKLGIFQRPNQVIAGSVEYIHDDWLFAAEYARTFRHQRTTLPNILPTIDEETELFYAMVNRRFLRRFEASLYYSVFHPDADDRRGKDTTRFPERFYAWQRDLAATIRYDVNEYWLWKLEAHFIDGVADLYGSTADPARYWGLFLFKTTVTF